MSESKGTISSTDSAPVETGREVRYNAQAIEEKWFQRWQADPTLYQAEPAATTRRQKYYVLEMLDRKSTRLNSSH